MQNKKANVYTTVTSAPAAMLLLTLILIFYGIYFFALGGAAAPERSLQADGFTMSHEMYSLLQTTSGQQTYAEHISERYQFPDELKPIMQEMQQKSEYKHLFIQTWPEKTPLFLLDPIENKKAYKAPIRASVPTTDPNVAIRISLCDRGTECE